MKRVSPLSLGNALALYRHMFPSSSHSSPGSGSAGKKKNHGSITNEKNFQCIMSIQSTSTQRVSKNTAGLPTAIARLHRATKSANRAHAVLGVQGHAARTFALHLEQGAQRTWITKGFKQLQRTWITKGLNNCNF